MANKPKRRQRRQGDLPAGFTWRDGRPRWIPSPTRRAQGWRAIDLKDAWGHWLKKGPALERAQAIADAVAAWAAGEAVPAGFAAIAPKGVAKAAGAKGALNPRSIAALLEAYYEAPKFRALAPATQGDYRSKHRRFFEVLCGSSDDAKVERVKALDVDILLPPQFGEVGDFELERVYDGLTEAVGLPMANGVHAAMSAWLGWCVKKKRIWPTNPAGLVERRSADGRIVVYEWAELADLVQAADALGRPSIGDALIFGVDLSWSEQDLLAITDGQVSPTFHVKHRRIKTGNAGNPRLLALGQARLAMIRQRWREAGLAWTKDRPLIVCELTGKAWAPSTFQHEFAAIRAHVARALPTVADKQFRDTRDTAVTYAYEAGLDIPGICSRTLHSPQRAQAVIAKHYGAIRQGLADAAAEKLDEHFAKMGYRLDTTLALPAPKEG